MEVLIQLSLLDQVRNINLILIFYCILANAEMSNCDLYEVNGIVNPAVNTSVFRAGLNLSFEFIVRDTVSIKLYIHYNSLTI